MKVGGASWSGVLKTDLTEPEKKKLKAIMGGRATTRFKKGLNKALKILEWDRYEANAASWGETRPEMEALVELVDRFTSQFMEYTNARVGSPKSAAVFLASDQPSEADESPIDNIEPKVLHYTELRDALQSFQRRARRNLEEKIADAKAIGRPSDLNFGQLVFNIKRLLDEHKIKSSITTNRDSNDLVSPFWGLIVEIVSRIRKRPHAGFNTSQAALQRIKRDLRKFREKYPHAEGSKG